jgi:nicotinic acid mononucleotide adenylyltransferase
LAARLVRPACTSGRVGLLPGSFNPPTNAHVALAAAGRAAGLTCVYYVLAQRTVDKERVTGIPLDDRLALLSQLGEGVASVAQGLYVDIATEMRSALPESELVFLVGHDKIVQIFDPKYYRERDAALDELFGLASFLVAPRGDADHDELAELLARPENRRWGARVAPLPFDERHRDASSTRVRRGESHDVPSVVAEYLARASPFL